MIEGQLGVGLAAAEVGLQVDDAVGARLPAQRVEHVADQAAQGARQVGALEEEQGIPVVGRALLGDGPAEVDREQRLGDAVLADVLVGCGALAPGGQFGGHRRLPSG